MKLVFSLVIVAAVAGGCAAPHETDALLALMSRCNHGQDSEECRLFRCRAAVNTIKVDKLRASQVVIDYSKEPAQIAAARAEFVRLKAIDEWSMNHEACQRRPI